MGHSNGVRLRCSDVNVLLPNAKLLLYFSHLNGVRLIFNRLTYCRIILGIYGLILLNKKVSYLVSFYLEFNKIM
jgi:hypothetical protein